LAQLANILACITLYELLCLSKESKEALRDALADSETFLTQVLAIPTDDKGLDAPNVIWCNNRCHPLPSNLRICSSKIINMIDLCTTLGTLVLHVLRGSKLIQGFLSALSQRGFSIFWVSHLAGYPPPLQPSMASTPGVVTL